MAATIKDISQETGLSLATISKYLNGGVLREKNRIAIEKAIKKLDYQVNEYARGLKSNKSRTIGVVIPELSNLFITHIISVMETILQENGYSVMICDCHTDGDRECRAVEFLIQKRVDGIINMPVCQDGRHLQPALEKEIPVLLLDRPLEKISRMVSCVMIDNQDAARVATRRLLEMGHRRIGIIVGPQDVYTSGMRLNGYRMALEEYGVDPDEKLIAYGDYTVKGGHRQICHLLDGVPDMTAVFVTNYEMTLGALIAVNERGVQIPRELSFIGFDNLDLSLVVRPRLTIVTQPLEEIGKQAAELMMERLSGARSTPLTVSLYTSLQEGESVIPLEVQ